MVFQMLIMFTRNDSWKLNLVPHTGILHLNRGQGHKVTGSHSILCPNVLLTKLARNVTTGPWNTQTIKQEQIYYLYKVLGRIRFWSSEVKCQDHSTSSRVDIQLKKTFSCEVVLCFLVGAFLAISQKICAQFTNFMHHYLERPKSY